MASPLLMMQVVATIDHRTTTICLHANGMMIQPGGLFETLAGSFPYPPFHIHCRSIVRPWQPGFASDARREANEELLRRPMKDRRIGPNGPEIKLPPAADGNPPVQPSQAAVDAARQARIDAKKERLKVLVEEARKRQTRKLTVIERLRRRFTKVSDWMDAVVRQARRWLGL